MEPGVDQEQCRPKSKVQTLILSHMFYLYVCFYLIGFVRLHLTKKGPQRRLLDKGIGQPILNKCSEYAGERIWGPNKARDRAHHQALLD